MEEISRRAGEFFRTYSRDDARTDIEFAKAFGNLFATISSRLCNEENILYKEFDKLYP